MQFTFCVSRGHQKSVSASNLLESKFALNVFTASRGAIYLPEVFDYDAGAIDRGSTLVVSFACEPNEILSVYIYSSYFPLPLSIQRLRSSK